MVMLIDVLSLALGTGYKECLQRESWYDGHQFLRSCNSHHISNAEFVPCPILYAHFMDREITLSSIACDCQTIAVQEPVKTLHQSQRLTIQLQNPKGICRKGCESTCSRASSLDGGC